MATEQAFSFSIASMVEDVLQQHSTRLCDQGLASRKAEEASLRRYEAAGWLRKTVGVVGGKDLPAEPSEEEFRLGLRSGIILCNVLNKVQPGAVPKVVEGPCDSVIIADGAALSAYQYFENLRNFLVAVEELGLPAFQASDLEQGGKSARIVNCVLALKSYSDWKQGGGNGSWKLGGNLKPQTCGKPFVRKHSEPFMNSFSRTLSPSEKSIESFSSDLSSYCDLSHDLNEAGSSRSVNMLVRDFLSDRKPEDIPIIVESMLNKVMEEFEHRLAGQNELMKTTVKDMSVFVPDKSLSKTAAGDIEMEENLPRKVKRKSGAIGSVILKRNQKELRHILQSTKAGMQILQNEYLEEFNNLGTHLHGLAQAASRYQKVLEENRKLYNQVQDLKGNIRVYCRVRPFLPGQPNRASTVDHIEEGNITIIAPSKYSKEGRKSFTFNKVFGPSATQGEVFSDTRPLIRSVLDGFNVCIFAYGQTGSGKTHTMSGPPELTEEGLGVNYRALGDLFLLSEQRKDTVCYDISVQMLEIYNEQVRDLLVTDEIRNSSQNGINVPDANLVPVSSTSDVITLMNLGQKNRAVGATAMNDRSSRSHSCLTVHVQGKDLTSGSILRGCMHLVDLAGSERVEKSEATGDRLKEAQHINRSLSALGDVIFSLAQKNSHVPYRNSKLTQLLQDSLGGQAKTLMFVHISPEPEGVGETISTLKFAERVSTIELGAARVNKDSADVKELKEQIAGLKAALARKEGETESLRHAPSSSPEPLKIKSCGSSPSHPRWKSIGDLSVARRQPMEDFGNLEVRKNSSLMPKRRSLDLQDILMNPPSWLPIGSSPELSGKEDDKNSVYGDWVDKIMVNKLENASRDENSAAHLEVDNRQLPHEMFGQSHNGRYEMATDDSDELEAATSDSSEPDVLSQLTLPKVTNIPNGVGSKTKKTNPRKAKSSESRGSIPSLIPSSSRIKPPNGVSQPSHKPGRQASSLADGKRKSGNAKRDY
ncbi:Kinesin-4 [Morella rubra]|uniref:Kinesin-4 n=1 Tax=Morella rubra TaxID=262757 RepID=A0A6A1V295_9ROSI|nr:Kinesin-4 [Morella rubra]